MCLLESSYRAAPTIQRKACSHFPLAHHRGPSSPTGSLLRIQAVSYIAFRRARSRSHERDIEVDSGAPVATLHVPCRGTWRRSPVQSSHRAQKVIEGCLSFQGKSTFLWRIRCYNNSCSGVLRTPSARKARKSPKTLTSAQRGRRWTTGLTVKATSEWF